MILCSALDLWVRLYSGECFVIGKQGRDGWCDMNQFYTLRTRYEQAACGCFM